jgi:hypothetical protein
MRPPRPAPRRHTQRNCGRPVHQLVPQGCGQRAGRIQHVPVHMTEPPPVSKCPVPPAGRSAAKTPNADEPEATGDLVARTAEALAAPAAFTAPT